MRHAMWKIALLCLLAVPAYADTPGIFIVREGCGDTPIEQGCARVDPLPGINADFPHLLQLEQQARTQKIGIWADPAFAVRDPFHARTLTDSYGLVEGIVLSTSKTKGHLYLNFGPDWKTDFTVELTTDAAHELLARTIDWQQLKGRKIRVRGWVFWRYGPMILVTTDAQIEVL